MKEDIPVRNKRPDGGSSPQRQEGDLRDCVARRAEHKTKETRKE